MKTFLVPTELHEAMLPTLETALLLARRTGAVLHGFPLSPIGYALSSAEVLGGLVWTEPPGNDEEQAAKSRLIWDTFMRDRGVPMGTEATERPAAQWRHACGDDVFLGDHGRSFDLVVVGRPSRNAGGPRLSTFESALFETGRPVLVAPHRAPGTIGDRVVVVWNGSTETARAIAFALPLLRDAGRVVVLTVEGAMVPGPTGQEIAAYLAAHGIAAEVEHGAAKGRTAGERTLECAAGLNADLLIKGAYTQSRLRQMIFGGVTSHILAHAEVPVFMAY